MPRPFCITIENYACFLYTWSRICLLYTSFMPTGGINADNIQEYLGFDKIVACGGSWMVKDAYINAGEFDKIRELTDEAAKLVK